MTDFNLNDTQMLVQAIERPASVTIFGVLNIVTTALKLPVIITELVKRFTSAETLKLFEDSGLLLLLNVVMAGLFIWLGVLGIGLLTMKRWARRGCCMYARIQILIIVIFFLLSAFQVISASMGRSLYGFFIMSSFQFDRLIYPVLLFIFMQTADVKKAFAAIGG